MHKLTIFLKKVLVKIVESCREDIFYWSKMKKKLLLSDKLKKKINDHSLNFSWFEKSLSLK